MTGFSRMFANSPLAAFWVTCCRINCKRLLFANCLVAYIIGLWTHIAKTWDWMIMLVNHFRKDIVVFIFLCFISMLIYLWCGWLHNLACKTTSVKNTYWTLTVFLVIIGVDNSLTILNIRKSCRLLDGFGL